MTHHKTNGLESAATDQALTRPESNQNEALASLSDCVAIIQAQQQADIVYDLVAGGRQAPDLLHKIIREQDQVGAFLAQIQKRIARGAG